jgi:hypothetical protein
MSCSCAPRKGGTFKSAYPLIFRPLSTHLLTDAQKEALEQRLNRYVLMSLVPAFMLAGLVDFTLFIMARDLDAGSPTSWLRVGVVGIVVAIPFSLALETKMKIITMLTLTMTMKLLTFADREYDQQHRGDGGYQHGWGVSRSSWFEEPAL